MHHWRLVLFAATVWLSGALLQNLVLPVSSLPWNAASASTSAVTRRLGPSGRRVFRSGHLNVQEASRPSRHCLDATNDCYGSTTSLLRSVGGCGPLSESEAAALVDDMNCLLSECCRFSASFSETKQLLMNLGSFVMNMLQTLDASLGRCCQYCC